MSLELKEVQFMKKNRNKDAGSIFVKYKKGIVQALNGIVYAIEKELNLLVIMFFILLILIFCFIFPVTIPELLAIVISSFCLMAFEMVNTSVEALTDLVTTKDHPLAKIAKDSASGAVFLFFLIFIVVLGIVFVPKIMAIF